MVVRLAMAWVLVAAAPLGCSCGAGTGAVDANADDRPAADLAADPSEAASDVFLDSTMTDPVSETPAEAPSDGPTEVPDVGCSTGGFGSCTTAADCVPGECCHPTTCVSAMYAPDCSMTYCSLIACVPCSMDCGAGYCDCIDGVCTSVITTACLICV